MRQEERYSISSVEEIYPRSLLTSPKETNFSMKSWVWCVAMVMAAPATKWSHVVSLSFSYLEETHHTRMLTLLGGFLIHSNFLVSCPLQHNHRITDF